MQHMDASEGQPKSSQGKSRPDFVAPHEALQAAAVRSGSAISIAIEAWLRDQRNALPGKARPTMIDFSERIHVSRGTLYALKSGQRLADTATLLAIAHACGVSAGALLDGRVEYEDGAAGAPSSEADRLGSLEARVAQLEPRVGRLESYLSPPRQTTPPLAAALDRTVQRGRKTKVDALRGLGEEAVGIDKAAEDARPATTRRRVKGA